MNNVDIISLLQSRIGTADWSKWQIHRWVYYDYVRYPTAGTNQLDFFVNAEGSVDPNSSAAKTKEQTNLPKARTFGQVYYIIQQIRTHVHILPKKRQVSTIANDADVIATTLADMMPAVYNMMNAGVLNIKFADRDYFEVVQPFVNCPPGFGPHVFNHAAASYRATVLVRGNSRDCNVYTLSPPQLVEPEQTINASITFPAANSPALTGLVDSVNPAMDIGLIFDGYIARPAQ